MSALYELLHNQITFIHEDASFFDMEKSCVLEQLKQKIPLSNISRLVGNYLIPNKKPRLYYQPKEGQKLKYVPSLPAPARFRGMGVNITAYLDNPCRPIGERELYDALKYFKIHLHNPALHRKALN